MTISVVIADDHAIYREGLHSMLDITPGIRVLAEASNGTEALALCENLQPDVAVLDWGMPGMNGLDVVKHLSFQQPDTHVVMLSVHDEESYVVTALQNGACGYILKEESIIHLIKAVYAAANGQRYISPMLRKLASKMEFENINI